VIAGGDVFDGGPEWNALEVPEGDRYAWADDSTYVRRPSFLENVPREPEPQGDIDGARVLALDLQHSEDPLRPPVDRVADAGDSGVGGHRDREHQRIDARTIRLLEYYVGSDR